jgi:hypothetical protein
VEEIHRLPPSAQTGTATYGRCWHVSTEILVDGLAHSIDLYFGFPKTFPFSLPDVYFTDTKWDYFPHIDYNNRKLCLFEDIVTYDVKRPGLITRDCLKQAKSIIEQGANKTNYGDFLQEISSYWRLTYQSEKEIESNWYVLGGICDSGIYTVLRNNKAQYLVVSEGQNEEDRKWFKPSSTERILFLHNYKIPDVPPYAMSWDLLKSALAPDDYDKVRSFIKSTKTLNLLFPLNRENLYGGIHLSNIEVSHKGFRPKSLDAVKMLDLFMKKTKFQRFIAQAYSSQRIDMRTAGEIQQSYKFAIIGCGSIGSNLCNYLKAYNNVSFKLVDNDFFTIDNIGRHYLGFDSLNRYKVKELQRYLKSFRPEMIIEAKTTAAEELEESDIESLSDYNAIFLCTGNVMTELYILRQLEQKGIFVPKIILWLEPYAIAGHMIYLSSHAGEDILRQTMTDSYLYTHNLITAAAYKNGNDFTKRDSGCNGAYTNYSGNDVIKFLSAMYPYICDIIENGQKESLCYRWVGNIDIANQRCIYLKEKVKRKGLVETIIIE